MDFFFATTIFFALLYLRALRVNDKLRRTDPWDRAWRQFQKRQHRAAR